MCLTTRETKDAIRNPYAFPGGYPKYLILDDGAALCMSCARTEWPQVCDSLRRNVADGWRADAVDINWEDPDMQCAHCSDLIESAYGEPTPATPRCDQCAELMINGVRCHETGCPNS